MKIWLVAISICLFGISSNADESKVIRLSEPVVVTDEAEVFGAPLDPLAIPITLEELMKHPETFMDVALRLETRVAEVCQKKGCFYIATNGQQSLRVAFKDYAFFVPTDIGGKTVTMTGRLIERERSEEEAEHFRADAQSDDIPSGTVYELLADSVRVPT